MRAVGVVAVCAACEADCVEEQEAAFAGQADISAVAGCAVLGTAGRASAIDDDRNGSRAISNTGFVVEIGGS